MPVIDTWLVLSHGDRAVVSTQLPANGQLAARNWFVRCRHRVCAVGCFVCCTLESQGKSLCVGGPVVATCDASFAVFSGDLYRGRRERETVVRAHYLVITSVHGFAQYAIRLVVGCPRL